MEDAETCIQMNEDKSFLVKHYIDATIGNYFFFECHWLIGMLFLVVDCFSAVTLSLLWPRPFLRDEGLEQEEEQHKADSLCFESNVCVLKH